MASIRKHLDVTSIGVINLTLVLFVAAILVKGWTHDLLLEAGVFLVSVKLILQTYKNSVATASLESRLQAIHTTLQDVAARVQSKSPPGEESASRAATRAAGFAPVPPGAGDIRSGE